MVLLLQVGGVHAQAVEEPSSAGGHTQERAPWDPGRFEISANGIALPLPVAELEVVAESLHAYVAARLGSAGARKIQLTFELPYTDPCGPRGLGGGNGTEGRITVHLPEGAPAASWKGVLAHEIAHVLQPVRTSVRHVRGWGEGMASWAAGKYYLEWQGHDSFQDAVRGYVASSDYLLLREIDRHRSPSKALAAHPDDCISRRDLLYTEWAAFIEYLIESRALTSVQDVLRGGALVDVFGAEFYELEDEWLATLRDALE